MSAIKRILVPTDFSEESKAALRYACELATATNAALSILHVVEDPRAAGGFTQSYGLPQHCSKKSERSAGHKLEGLLDEVLTPDEAKRYRVRLVLRKGGAAQEILHYLQDHPNIDLVVMTTHGRGDVSRLMTGSVVDEIVHAANCPVLTLRRPNVEHTKTGRAA